MTTRALILLVLSILFGLGAAWMASNWLQQQGQAKTTPDTMVNVVVARAGLTPGAPITSNHVYIKPIDARLVPPGALTSLEQTQGMVARNHLYEGDILRSERLAPEGEGSTLSVLLDPGMRAVTVRVNDVIGVAGFLLPGNRVDILATDENMTQTVLKNLKVLAVDQTQHTDENRPKLVRAVTLEVDPGQAEQLVNASARGRIQLALRNPSDKLDLILPPTGTAATEPAPRPRARPSSVLVIKGASQQQIPVKS